MSLTLCSLETLWFHLRPQPNLIGQSKIFWGISLSETFTPHLAPARLVRLNLLICSAVQCNSNSMIFPVLTLIWGGNPQISSFHHRLIRFAKGGDLMDVDVTASSEFPRLLLLPSLKCSKWKFRRNLFIIWNKSSFLKYNDGSFHEIWSTAALSVVICRVSVHGNCAQKLPKKSHFRTKLGGFAWERDHVGGFSLYPIVSPCFQWEYWNPIKLIELEDYSTSKSARYRSRTDWWNLTNQWICVLLGNWEDICVHFSCFERNHSLSMRWPGCCEMLEEFLWGDRTFSRFEFREKLECSREKLCYFDPK
jgi:hypothetical protein